MRTVSQRWHASIMRGKNGSDDPEVIFKPFPICPWLHPRLHPRLVEIVLKLGIKRQLAVDEPIFRTGRVDQFVLVTKGVTGRSIGNPSGQASTAIAYSTPNHIGAGNLNFMTGRPAIGRYFALTPAEIVYCPRDLLRSVIATDPDLVNLMNIQLELATLSDRLGFCCLSLLGAEDRIKSHLVTWSLNFGEMVRIGDVECIKMPSPLPRPAISQVSSTSMVWIDKHMKEWRDKRLWKRDGDWVYLKPELLDPVYKWMRKSEEELSNFEYPQSISDLILPTNKQPKN